MPLTPEEQAALDERFEALEDRNTKLERLIRSGKAFTTNPLALATDLDDLGSVKTHLDFEEAPLTPVNPPSDVLRLYALDVSGTTYFAVRDVNGLGRTRKLPMSFAGEISPSGGHMAAFGDNSTHSILSSVPIPSDWVTDTDITLNIMLYKAGTGVEKAILRSWISSKSDTETESWNIESNFNVNIDMPASSELEQLTRTITGTGVSAGETIQWNIQRLGADGADTLGETLFLSYGPWMEYTALL